MYKNINTYFYLDSLFETKFSSTRYDNPLVSDVVSEADFPKEDDRDAERLNDVESDSRFSFEELSPLEVVRAFVVPVLCATAVLRKNIFIKNNLAI